MYNESYTKENYFSFPLVLMKIRKVLKDHMKFIPEVLSMKMYSYPANVLYCVESINITEA